MFQRRYRITDCFSGFGHIELHSYYEVPQFKYATILLLWIMSLPTLKQCCSLATHPHHSNISKPTSQWRQNTLRGEEVDVVITEGTVCRGERDLSRRREKVCGWPKLWNDRGDWGRSRKRRRNTGVWKQIRWTDGEKGGVQWSIRNQNKA